VRDHQVLDARLNVQVDREPVTEAGLLNLEVAFEEIDFLASGISCVAPRSSVRRKRSLKRTTSDRPPAGCHESGRRSC